MIRCEELWFWGKIIGIDSDYFVVLAVDFKDNYEFPKKEFYYCTSLTYNFVKLPETHHSNLIDIKKHNYTFLTGNPATVIERYEAEVDPNDVVQDQNENQEVNNANNENAENINNNEEVIKEDDNLEDTKEEIVVPEDPKKDFTELIKLSFLIKNIEQDTNVIPEGSFKLIPIHELRRNESFKGLKQEDLLKLEKYQHFRKVKDIKIKEILDTDEAIFRSDILEPISDDVVAGSWSIQLDSTKTIVNKLKLTF